MKWWLFLALPLAFFVSGCGNDEGAMGGTRRPAARYPSEPTGAENPPTQQPFNPNAPPENAETTTSPPAPPPTAPAPPKTTKADYPYGTPVPGKPGFVKSPYAADQGLVDVRGFPPGTEVKDPFTNKIFLVP